MANISKITLPNNNQYDIKDNIARTEVDKIKTDLTPLVKGYFDIVDCKPETIKTWIQSNYVLHKWVLATLHPTNASTDGVITSTGDISIIFCLNHVNYGAGIMIFDYYEHKGFATFRLSGNNFVIDYPYDKIDQLSTNLTTFEDFKNKVTITPGLDYNSQFYRIGKVASITMQTTHGEYSDNDLLFTLPSGYRPGNSTKIVGSINRSPCIITLESSGECRIYDTIPASSSRVYFMVTYLIGN